jgi:hypothetical protein
MTDSPPEQWFHFGAWRFDIQAAERLIQAEPRETIELKISGWARAYGLIPSSAGTFPIIGGADFDAAYAMTTDLKKPVILATLQSTDEGKAPEHLLIDGCHRVYRANVEGRTTLPAYVLDTAESLAIRSHVRHGHR